MQRLFLKKGSYLSIPVTLDTSVIPASQSVYDYVVVFAMKRTLTQPTYDILLDSANNPSQVLIQSSSSVNVILFGSNTSSLYAGTYYWGLSLQVATGSSTAVIEPPTVYNDIILFESIIS